MVKRKEPRTYWSEELIKACESMMNSEHNKDRYDRLTKKEAAAILGRLFEALKIALESLEAGDNGSCEKKDCDPVGDELLKLDKSKLSKKSCLGCEYLDNKYRKIPCLQCRRNCEAFHDGDCDGICDVGQGFDCHTLGCVKLCKDRWREKK